MVTALTLYGANTAATSLTTGASLFFANATTGGALTSHQTTVGTSTGFGELATFAKGTPWEALSTIGNPQGFGWIWDVTTMTGNQLVSGTWTPTLTFKTSVGNIVADIHMRAMALNTSTLVATLLGDMMLGGQTINTTQTTYTFAGSALPTWNFGTNEKIYCDVWLNITSNNTGSTSATVRMFLSSDASKGSTSVQVLTPGYQPTPAGISTVTVTNVGLNLIRDGWANANNPLITYVALGTSNTTPDPSDTALGNEVFRKPVTSFVNGASPGEVLINFYLAPKDAVGTNIEEIGFFGGRNASSTLNSGVLLAHGLIAHNPKLNTESMSFTLDLTL